MSDATAWATVLVVPLLFGALVLALQLAGRRLSRHPRLYRFVQAGIIALLIAAAARCLLATPRRTGTGLVDLAFAAFLAASEYRRGRGGGSEEP